MLSHVLRQQVYSHVKITFPCQRSLIKFLCRSSPSLQTLKVQFAYADSKDLTHDIFSSLYGSLEPSEGNRTAILGNAGLKGVIAEEIPGE